MEKGNPVFNSFDKVIHGVYRSILELDGRGRDLDAVSGSGANVADADAVLRSKFRYPWQFFKKIRDHERIAQIHATQDDRPVIVNDGNSQGFGKASADFAAAVMQWATTDAAEDPMASWRQLVSAGSDIAAQESYVQQGSSSAGTPSSANSRRKRCVELSEFVNGELTVLVRKWLLAIRQDLNLRRVSGRNRSVALGVLSSEAQQQHFDRAPHGPCNYAHFKSR